MALKTLNKKYLEDNIKLTKIKKEETKKDISKGNTKNFL